MEFIQMVGLLDLVELLEILGWLELGCPDFLDLVELSDFPKLVD